MKKFSDLSREVDEDLERKIQELYDTYGEIDEALIKKLNLQALIRRAKKTIKEPNCMDSLPNATLMNQRRVGKLIRTP